MSTTIDVYQLEQVGNSNQAIRVPRTRPTPGPRQVLIQVGAVSLNYRDLLTLRGLSGPIRSGLVPLSDAAGTIVAVGAEVSRWKEGDRVSPGFFPQWHSGSFQRQYLATSLGGGQTDGVLGEQILASEDAIVAIPGHLSLAEAATLPCAAVTAWHALFARGGLKTGETVLVLGTGGVALFALQLAAAQGAKVIVLSSSDEKLERARALGAWQAINYRTHTAWHEEVLRITEGRGADHVVELGGQETYDRSIASVAAGGKIAQIGVLTGFAPKPNVLPLQFINASVNGICVGSVEHFAGLNAFVERHDIHPVVDRSFGFDEVPAAYDYFGSGQRFGKVVVTL